MARTPFTAEWIQAGSGIFQWGKQAAYWKGAKGWWASRKGHEGIQGPFRTAHAAQSWAEEPFRDAHRTKIQAQRDEARRIEENRVAKRNALKAREAERTRLREEQALQTWNGLPPDARHVTAGQVWALRDPKHASHQVLVVEVKKTLAIVLARDSKATPWKGLPQEPRTLSHLPKLYKLVGAARIPAGAR